MKTDLKSPQPRATIVWPHPQKVDIVFGLDWSPLVGGVPAKLGRSRARSLQATHYLVLGSLAAVVGCGIVQKRVLANSAAQFDRTQPQHSAAAIFAMTHQEGVCAAVGWMPQKGYWLIAANAGLVLAQTDCWYESLEEIDTALQVLHGRFPGLQVIKLAELSADHLPEWLSAKVCAQSRLQHLSGKRHLTVRMICVFCVTLSMTGIGWVSIEHTSKQPVVVPEENGIVLWQQVYDRFMTMHPVHPYEQLLRVVQAWHQAPLTPGGWKLKQIVCEPSQMDWHCAARYQRVKKLALSEHLDAAKPNGWVAEFTDLEHGMLRWQVPGAASAFQPIKTSVPLKTWLSYLQSVAPVFESIQIGSGTPIALAAPLNKQGVALAQPPHFKALTRRHIAIKGPLRSMSALKGLPIPVRWRGLQLDLGLPAGQGISRSELIVSLMGEVFETHE